MDGLRMKTGMGRAAFWSRLFRGTLTTVAAASLALAATAAHAACGFAGSGSAIKMPMLQEGRDAAEAWKSSNAPIVGLWAVVYTNTADGSVFNQTLDQWHSDGTEFENAFVPVLQGNICFGVWKSTGWRAVRLHHIGWTYDPVAGGTANGTFTLDEDNTVSKDGKSYTGTFTFTAFDLKGNTLQTVKGTIAAQRITVD